VIGIIDDDEGIRTAFERLLGSGGYETVLFESADAYLSAGCPLTDCLVVDVNMPGMNGLDLWMANSKTVL
jgi:FixJ family two-component response regulator